MANRNMLYLFRLGAEYIAHPLAWSHGASVRQLSFYGPVSLYLGILSLFGFQGATEAVCFGAKVKYATTTQISM